MIFFVSVMFISLFYVVPLRNVVVDWPPIFPVLGREGSWVLAAALVYSVMALAALIVVRFEDVLWPSLPALRKRVIRRTGIDRIDSLGWRFALLASILFWTIDLTLLPLGVAAFLGFASVARQPVAVRKVKLSRTREIGEEASVVRVFDWRFDDPSGTVFDNRMELRIDTERYEQFVRANPANLRAGGPHTYRRLVNEGLTQEIENVAGEVRDITRERGLDSIHEISLLLAFVQSIPGAVDTQTKGRRYTRWPIETLYENVGDSDCKSVLLAALAKALDYPAIIVESAGRTAVGVGACEGISGRFLEYRGVKYYYCEPNLPGQRVGEAPPEMAAAKPWVFNLDETDEAA